MKTFFLNGGLLCAAFLLFSCENSKSADGKTGSSDQKTSSCLAKFDHDYSKLLTKEDVLKHISLDDSATLEIKYDAESVKKHPEYGEIYYQWPSDRPDVQISPNSPVKLPDTNSIGFTNLSFKDDDPAKLQARFHTAYGNMTQAQVDAAMARLEAADLYKDKPEDLESAKKMVLRRAESNNTPVEGLGDAAYWFPTKAMGLYFGSKIVVLTGNAQFEVIAKVSADDEENFEVAKKIALEILAKCQ